eukprot:1142682-Ditylum_brightwellii.AAC.1
MNDNEDNSIIVLETSLHSDDDMGDANIDDDSVWDIDTVILDDELVAMAEELEKDAARYICNIIMNSFLHQIK